MLGAHTFFCNRVGHRPGVLRKSYFNVYRIVTVLFTPLYNADSLIIDLAQYL